LLESVCSSYSRSKFDNYLSEAENKVFEAIIKPFGLAKVIFDGKDEKFNPNDYRSSRFKNEADKMKHDNTVNVDVLANEDWTPDDLIDESPDDFLCDAYSGQDISPGAADADHINSIKDFHDKYGYVLNKDRRKAMGSDPDNIELTHRSGNRSKGENDLDEWHDKKCSDGRSNKEKYGHDNRRTNAAKKRAQEALERHKPTVKEQASYHLNSGVKMGLQQAMGALFLELARAMWDEAKDVLASGVYTNDNNSLIKAIAERLKRVGEKVVSKWKDFVVAFRDGSISGFLSSLITSILKLYTKVAQNTVRIIREGFMSLVTGFKFVLFPPEGLTKEEAFHQAGKIIIGGVAVGLGVLAEESVTTAITFIPGIGTVIAPFADKIAPVLLGIAVGLGTSLLCYLWDKLDLVGVEEAKRHKFIIDMLQKHQENATKGADEAMSACERLHKDCNDIISSIDDLDKEFWVLAKS